MEKSNFKHRRLDENHVLLTEKKGKEVTAILVHRDASPLESGLKDIDDDLVDSDLPSYTYSEYKGKKFGQKKLLHMLRQAEPKELDSVDGALSFYRSADAKNHFEYIELNVARCMDAINKAELFETLGMKDDLLMSIESAACFALNAAKENNQDTHMSERVSSWIQRSGYNAILTFSRVRFSMIQKKSRASFAVLMKYLIF